MANLATTSSPGRVEDALERSFAAYRVLSAEPVPTRAHPSRETTHSVLAPLDYDAGWRLVEAGLRRLADGNFPCLQAAPWSLGSVAAMDRAVDAMCAEQPVEGCAEQLEHHEGYQSLFGPLRDKFLGTALLLKAPVSGYAIPAHRAFVAAVTRPRIGFADEGAARGMFCREDYDILTLPWRCRIGPIHPDDDNDVCLDAVVEVAARRLQRHHPGLTREAARVDAALRVRQPD